MVNPVKATCIKYKDDPNSIQGMNDTCFGICAAFSGTYDTFAMDPQCTKACVDFIEQKKKQIYGVGSCDHQAPYRPVFWGQVPRYVPQLIKQGMKANEARKKCRSLCQGSNLSLECQEKCDIDADAVEEYNKPESKLLRKDLNPSPQNQSNHGTLWIIIISIIILIPLIIIILRNIRK